MVVRACSHRTWKLDAEGSGGHLELHNELEYILGYVRSCRPSKKEEEKVIVIIKLSQTLCIE